MMKPSAPALALALAFVLLVLSVPASGLEPACDETGGACPVEQDDLSALQLRTGQSELAAAAGGKPDGYNGTYAEDLKKILRKLANSFKYLTGYLTEFEPQSCDLTSAGGCPITDTSIFAPKVATKVYPGGNTQCIDGSEFFFEVTAGDAENLHIHFQGGGACWDQISYNMPACTTQAYPNPPYGVFDLSNPLNPLKEYSVIVIQYCSGDMHAGNAEQSWGKNGTMVKQVGYYNADAAIKYALSQFPKLQNFVISGSSAGSLGLQFWSSNLINLFADRKPDVAVIADSFLGVLWPPSMLQTSEAWLYARFNMCNPGVLTPTQMSKCNKKTLLLQDMFVESMETHRDARFSVINSKADATQIYFEKAFELTSEYNIRGFFMTAGQFYKSASLMVVDYLDQSNLFSYFVDGTAHTYLPQRWLYTTSPEGNENTNGSPMLIDWLTDFISPSQQAARSVCFGPEKCVTKHTLVGKNETDYCAKGLDAVP